MALCKLCGRSGPFISSSLSFCLSCLRRRPKEALELAREAHGKSRARWGLPLDVPRDGGNPCGFCVNRCSPGAGRLGLCGVRGLPGLSGEQAYLEWYYDPFPTNCVAEWVCGERGPGYNLAVFFGGCTFDCLFCQNWHHRKLVGREEFLTSVDELVGYARKEDVMCLCFFGGDPSPYMDFVVKVSENLRDKIRLCIETNGSMSWGFLKRFMKFSGKRGVVKFDLKAFNNVLHIALTGSSNENTLDNIKMAVSFGEPMVVVSTLLVPGYVDEEEVFNIAGFLASLDRDIPYSLLAFYPQYMMDDLPPTPRALAEACYRAAKDAGLRRVKIGNVHLLW